MTLIDKEKALTAIADEIRALHNEDTILIGESPEEIGLIKAFDVINHMPIVEERAKGKWIEYTDCEGKSRRITCDQCGHEEWNWLDPNFCPNCGSDMKGEQK